MAVCPVCCAAFRRVATQVYPSKENKWLAVIERAGYSIVRASQSFLVSLRHLIDRWRILISLGWWIVRRLTYICAPAVSNAKKNYHTFSPDLLENRILHKVWPTSSDRWVITLIIFLFCIPLNGISFSKCNRVVSLCACICDAKRANMFSIKHFLASTYPTYPRCVLIYAQHNLAETGRCNSRCFWRAPWPPFWRSDPTPLGFCAT